MRISTCLECQIEFKCNLKGPKPKLCPEHKRNERLERLREWNRDNPEYFKTWRKEQCGYLGIGSCEICGENRKLVRDHDHKCCPQTPTKSKQGGLCGECWRGNICSQCNTALGMVYEDPIILLKMIDYITKTNESAKTGLNKEN